MEHLSQLQSADDGEAKDTNCEGNIISFIFLQALLWHTLKIVKINKWSFQAFCCLIALPISE